VLLIEHHLDVIKTADHVIDLGPEGGHAGGTVVVAGAPEDVAKCKASHTGRFSEGASSYVVSGVRRTEYSVIDRDELPSHYDLPDASTLAYYVSTWAIERIPRPRWSC
jgi:excinuclease ABC subunit A